MKFPCTHHFAPPRPQIFSFNPPCPVEKRLPKCPTHPCDTCFPLCSFDAMTQFCFVDLNNEIVSQKRYPTHGRPQLTLQMLGYVGYIFKLSQLPTLSKCFHSTSYKCGIKSSHVTVSVLVHLCHDDIAGLCFLSMWNNKDIKSRSNPRLCTHTLPPPFLSPIKKKPNSQKKLNMAVYLEISCKLLMFRSLILPNNVTTHNSFLALLLCFSLC